MESTSTIFYQTLTGIGQFAAVMVLACLGGYAIFRIQRWVGQRGSLYTLKTIGAIKDSGPDFLAVTVDRVCLPGKITPEDGTPMFRVAIEDRPWLMDGQGTDGIGYLFETAEMAEESTLTYLRSLGFTSFSNHTDL